jgi:hypothetical protein
MGVPIGIKNAVKTILFSQIGKFINEIIKLYNEFMLVHAFVPSPPRISVKV